MGARTGVRALVLAAGQARRFGGGKLLAPYRGRPLLTHVLDVVQGGCKRGLLQGGQVVVGLKDDAARILCQKAAFQTIQNDAPELGLSRSLRLGLTDLEKRPADVVGAALVFLGDQPLVRLEVVEALIVAWRERGGAVLRPRYHEHPSAPGHPTLLDRSIWPLALQLEGDRGFASLLASTSIQTTVLDVAGDNPDVDTQADLHTLEELSP
jgi:molybdenum cofactor cytidylyltransferase